MNVVLIIGAPLSDARRDKLYDKNGNLKLVVPGSGKKKAVGAPEARGSTFLTRTRAELHVGFPILDTSGRYTAEGAVQVEDQVVPIGSMTAMSKMFRDQIKGAQKRWNLFSIWAEQAHGVKLGAGKLLLLVENE